VAELDPAGDVLVAVVGEEDSQPELVQLLGPQVFSQAEYLAQVVAGDLDGGLDRKSVV